MRLSTAHFIRLGPCFTRILAGPLRQADDRCLLTMEDCNTLQHAVHASDGRTYDAFALQHWFNVQDKRYVVTGCPIESVLLTPRIVSILTHRFCTILAFAGAHSFSSPAISQRAICFYEQLHIIER